MIVFNPFTAVLGRQSIVIEQLFVFRVPCSLLGTAWSVLLHDIIDLSSTLILLI